MTYLWGCATDEVTLPFFKSNIGPRHMDVGVGTGYYPVQVRKNEKEGKEPPQWPEQLLLVDLNSNCTNMAAARVGAEGCTRTLVTDILRPIPEATKGEKYDSISLMNLLHCLPGSTEYKSRAFSNLKPFLKEDGTLFGGTILGKGVKHNILGKAIMWLFNYNGMFHNWGDGKEEFLRVLRQEFGNVEHVVVGRILLFTAKQPLKA